jgi:SAM-dependent methyltransferase
MIARAKSLVRKLTAPLREARARARAPFQNKFEQRAPTHANAIDIFSGRWASDLSIFNREWRGGGANLIVDPRPDYAVQQFGANARLDGMSVLELGPLEGMHTWRLEQRGAARIVAIESNVEAYLKCLIMKEALGLKRAEFLLGDFNLYLQNSPERFDIVFACGVLYHMEDPLSLIRGIARATDRCLVWTHYFDERVEGRVAVPATLDGIAAAYYRANYQDRAQRNFWGGNKPSASWMTRNDILAAFRHFGLDEIAVITEDRDAKPGPTICFAARRAQKS